MMFLIDYNGEESEGAPPRGSSVHFSSVDDLDRFLDMVESAVILPPNHKPIWFADNSQTGARWIEIEWSRQ